MRFEAFVAARYLRGKRKNRFISLITIISMAGVAVGVMALIVVLSVMTGFQTALRETIIGNRAHLLVFERRPQPLTNTEPLMAALKEKNPEIVAAAPFIQVQGLIRAGRSGSFRHEGAFILGVDPALETAVTNLADNLTTQDGRSFGSGDLPGDKEIVLGYDLARKLAVGTGSQVAVYSPRTRIGPGGPTFTPIWLTVSGRADTKMSEYDSHYGWVNLNTARLLTGYEGVDGIHCKLTDPDDAQAVSQRIEGDSELGCRAVTWYESQQAFFGALKQEKLVMFIILSFIVLVAAFNITSTLIMVVMEKRRDIGILRTIGVSTSSILTLFMMEGLFIGSCGTMVGVVCGSLIAYYINPIIEFIAGILNVELWDKTIYYFDRVPSEVVPFDVAVITLSAIALTFLSTLYPAWSASRVDPVDALRYE
jgi:lipoprotein-releasing system permease protein